MGDMWDDLRSRVQSLSGEEIREALAAGPAEYREEALAIYREEAARRHLELPPPADEPPDDTGEEVGGGDEAYTRPGSGAVNSGAGEFTAADREVHCTHCDATTFVEHQVVLASLLQSAPGSAVPLPVTVLVCSSCGCLQWFGEPVA